MKIAGVKMMPAGQTRKERDKGMQITSPPLEKENANEMIYPTIDIGKGNYNNIPIDTGELEAGDECVIILHGKIKEKTDRSTATEKKKDAESRAIFEVHDAGYEIKKKAKPMKKTETDEEKNSRELDSALHEKTESKYEKKKEKE